MKNAVKVSGNHGRCFGISRAFHLHFRKSLGVIWDSGFKNGVRKTVSSEPRGPGGIRARGQRVQGWHRPREQNKHLREEEEGNSRRVYLEVSASRPEKGGLTDKGYDLFDF